MSSPGQSLPPDPLSPSESSAPDLFTAPTAEPSGRSRSVVVAAVLIVIALIVAALFFRGKHTADQVSSNVILKTDPYAQNLSFTDLAMSESSSLSGGKSTFIDGQVKNSGPATVTAVTMQVLFRNDVDLPPQVETLPLTLIRTHEPYVDTEPVSSAPLRPGDQVEFRLIFETVTGSWNQQMPELRPIVVTTR